MIYAEAVKMAGQERLDKEHGYNNRQRVVNREQDDKRKMWEEKKKLVTFIAVVINATVEVKSKTERIQIIVKAEVHHLDMRGLEEVRDNLSVQASQESPCTG